MVASRGKWSPSSVHLLLNEAIVEAVTVPDSRLIINFPPRHGKSTLISKYTPPWFLGNWPDKLVMLTTYETTFAESWGREARNVLREWGPTLYDIQVDRETSAVGQWKIEGHDGGMFAVGMEGQLTGRGADLMIVDDPIKGEQIIKSPTMLESQWDWFKGTAYPRLEPGSSVIILMTRWHEDDLTGKILSGDLTQGGADQVTAPWKVIRLPAIAEEREEWMDGQWIREPGDPLWPEKWSLKYLYDRKTFVGPYYWGAEYQQRPAPIEGNLFKRAWLNNKFKKVVDTSGEIVFMLPNYAVKYSECLVFSTYDPAATEKTRSDYSVCITWAITPRRDILKIGMNRERRDMDRHQAFIKGQFDFWPRLTFMTVDKRTYGIGIIQQAIREGLNVRESEIDTDKTSAAIPATTIMSNGRVFFDENDPDMEVIEHELLGFPNASHDDIVDNFSQMAEVANKFSALLAGATIERDEYTLSGRRSSDDGEEIIVYESQCHECGEVSLGKETGRRNHGTITFVRYNCPECGQGWSEQVLKEAS